MVDSNLATLQEQWTTLYKTTLPSLAKQKDPAQPRWPVHLDHCFARIILDNAVGDGKQPWTAVLKAPAVRNMSVEQLHAAIDLGERIRNGEVDLVGLDEISLACRGKGSKLKGKSGGEAGGKKRKSGGDGNGEEDEKVRVAKRTKGENGEGAISKYFLPSPRKGKLVKTESDDQSHPLTSSASPSPTAMKQEDRPTQLQQNQTSKTQTETTSKIDIGNFTSDEDPLLLIARHPALSPFRKQVLTLLCAVPRGKWTTYAAIADQISLSSSSSSSSSSSRTTSSPSLSTTSNQKKSSPRAVGSAMRNNPFAPLVPCHRVLASGGLLGGYGGGWGEEGKHAEEKRRRLREEGVGFDGKGRALGKAWDAWDK